MRVLFITNCSVLYGANRSMLEVIEELQKHKIQSNVILPEPGPIEAELDRLRCRYRVIKNCNGVHEAGAFNRKQAWVNLCYNLKCVYQIRQLLKTWKIDIIHTNNSVNLFGAMLALATGIPHVWHIREMLKLAYGYEYDFPKLTHWLMKRADKVLFISKVTRQYWEKHTHYKNAEVIYNGFDIEHYIDTNRAHSLGDKINLLLAGSIGPEKRPIDAVKAVYLLIQRGIKNVHLDIVGDGRKPEYMDKLRQYIQRHGLEEYIELLPFHGDLREIRKNSDIALMCSRGEALGRVTIESMAAGLLVIGANSGGTKELIEDGVSGYLYKVGSPRELADKIIYAIEHWDEAKKIIKTAQDNAEKTFSVKNYAIEIRKVYEQVVK